MKVPVSWLREFVDIDATPEQIAATMSVRGFAVEGIERVAGLSRRSGDAEAETVLDFEVTANRPDCMSIVGMAREVATAFELPLREPELPPPGGIEAIKWAHEPTTDLQIVIDAPELCPRYTGAVADVTMGPSPAWMQARLKACGVRPISNIVDITNYVLLELGQPMHAFDHARLRGREIRVRVARDGETIRTLDGQQRALSPEMLVIADAQVPVAVAGVMGGADSEVSDTTTVIVFESAYFTPLSVRRTSRKLGLKTEASMRFERGADRQMTAVAMRRAFALLERTGAGRERGQVLDRFGPGAAGTSLATLMLRRARVHGVLGMVVDDGDIERLLSALGFSLLRTDEGWRVSIPSRRVDVHREIDLVEEVARHYGFDRIPTTFPVQTSATPPLDPRITRARQLRQVMTGAGFSEALTFGFMAEAAATPFAAEGDLVPIANPLSENYGVLRPSALPGLLDAVAHNRRREQRDVRLFEIGNRFSRARGEHRALACAWTGQVGADHWSGGTRPVDFFDLKGIVERIAEAIGLAVHVEPCRESWLAPGRSAAVLAADGTRLGTLGQLAPSMAEAHGLPPGEAVYVAEIDLDAADARVDGRALHVDALPKYPSVTRDVSILVDDTLPAATLRETVREAAPATLVRVREFDRYAGKGIPESKISVSLRLTFRSPDRTLTDAEVQHAMEAVVAALASRHGAVQR
ncbi:MAG TPA: phenylalanine--tRNA ligase subunit beta [Vicinamibacterales bacterium]|nr:phenylalanine--tRNA ligase subunit beta [Vicinamibacterales bacterium]